MALPRVRMDFNGSALANFATEQDLRRQGLALSAGMRCVFYEPDSEDGVEGFLHGQGHVWWDAASQQFRVKIVGPLRFTPGTDLSALDPFYP